MILRNVSTTEHVATTPIAVPTEDTVRVETAAGAVRGLWREIVSHPERSGPEPRYSRSAAFHAIPYAEEPTGERRFMAPVRRGPWAAEREAHLPGTAPQRGSIFDDPAIPGPAGVTWDQQQGRPSPQRCAATSERPSLVPRTGFEPATFCSGGRRSIH